MYHSNNTRLSSQQYTDFTRVFSLNFLTHTHHRYSSNCNSYVDFVLDGISV